MGKNKKPNYVPRITTKKQFVSKSKEALSKPNASHIQVQGYVITSHAQNRMVERNIPAVDVSRTLKKVERTAPYDKKNDSFEKHGKRVTICVAAGTNIVKTLYELNARDAKKYHIQREPLTNYNRNNPHVIKSQKISGMKNSSTNVAPKRNNIDKKVKH